MGDELDSLLGNNASQNATDTGILLLTLLHKDLNIMGLDFF